MSRFYVTTTGPSADLVRADVLARHHRQHGDRVRFLSAVDSPDRDALALSYNDFVRPAPPAPGQPPYRLADQATALRAAVDDGLLRIQPAGARAEVLAHLAAGLPDRPLPDAAMAGLRAPITALGYDVDGPNYRRWWLEGDRRVHVVDSGSLLAHTAHWPAFLLAAGIPLPTDIVVTTDFGVDLGVLARGHGSDAVRWWLLRHAPSGSVGRAGKELPKHLGGLVDQVTVMIHRYRGSRPPTGSAPDAAGLVAVCREAPRKVHAALTAADFRQATDEVWRIAEEATRYLADTRPWDLANAERRGDTDAGERLDAVLASLLAACRALANELTPFIPSVATRIAERCAALSGTLAPSLPLFPQTG
ncbi:hypothetical protein [Umezawaea sp. Da 62-37]|uniref:hypothetical protein n=1 Tax=Umezawaea sp. Da 62-37 TaxID=3075927 RepID=UPI0028F6EF80|nr:hypothetical protein [Umezawaea sp. Da 62-37]WNV88931.1 hypothetical protein RM788_11695 [Umezawaea sp. Da 62-37]